MTTTFKVLAALTVTTLLAGVASAQPRAVVLQPQVRIQPIVPVQPVLPAPMPNVGTSAFLGVNVSLISVNGFSGYQLLNAARPGPVGRLGGLLLERGDIVLAVGDHQVTGARSLDQMIRHAISHGERTITVRNVRTGMVGVYGF